MTTRNVQPGTPLQHRRTLHVAVALLLFGVLPLYCLGRTTLPRAFPAGLSCEVRPYYRVRPDGTPGREIALTFSGAQLVGPATLEVNAGTIHETIACSGDPAGLSTVTALLPAAIGVREEAHIRILVRQGSDTIGCATSVPPMRHWTVFVFPHSHVDIGYSNTHANVEFIHKRNIDQGIALAEATREYPAGAQYHWNTEVMWPLERYLAGATAEQRDRLLNAVRNEELCPDAAYVNLLTSDCSDEELMQSLRPRREIAQLTGKPLDTYVQVDIPGMTWGLVTALAREGVHYVMMMPNGTRGNDSLVALLRQRPFWWVGQDGTSRVLFLNAGGYGAGMDKGGKTGRPWFGQRDRDKIPDVIKTQDPRADFLDRHLFRELPRLERQHHPYDHYVVTWAMWDNALLDADLPQAVKSWNEDYAYPHLIIASAHQIMQTLERAYGNTLPVVHGDFSEYWTDGAGTVARQTRMKRTARERLVQAEIVWSLLHPGKPAPRREFDEAWRNIVMCTEHTFTYENPAEPYFQDAIWKMKAHYYQEAEERSQMLLDDALAPATDKSNGALGPIAGPSNGGVAVINTNSWPHGGVVTLTPAESQLGDRIVDDDGQELICQRLSTGELAFLCPEVPAFGSRHCRVVAGRYAAPGRCSFSRTVLDNGLLRVQLDSTSGNIIHLRDKRTSREFVDVSINGGINVFLWQPARGAGEPQRDTVESMTLKETGPLVGEVLILSRAPGCRALTRSVRLVYGQPHLEITDVVDKLPLLPKDGVHFGFGFHVPGGTTRVDIPWGVIELEKDQWPAANRAWIAAQHFVDISNDSAGVTWCALDAPLVESGSLTANNTAGWDGKGDVWPEKLPRSSAIYSWVMNNHWFTNTPLTQEGPVTFRYRILPHGPYNAAAANRFGVEQAQPLLALATSRNPIAHPPLAVANDRVAVTILKPMSDGGVILRLRSFSAEQETVRLAWPAQPPRSIRTCDRGEQPGTAQTRDDILVPPMGSVTLRIDW